MEIRRKRPAPAINVSFLEYQVKTDDGEPNNILEEIVWQKEKEVDQWREQTTLEQLRPKVAAAPPVRDFRHALITSDRSPALIAEVKKASPSKGIIKENFDPVAIAQAYEAGGATCLSVLTDQKFFQGSFENLSLVRQAVNLPLLCKEFVIYPYQIYLARIHGADAVLLIASILSDQDLYYFTKIVKSVGMTALVEVHTLAELDRVLAIDGIDLIGINNRNLGDFSVSLETTQTLLTQRQGEIEAKGAAIVSESGLYTHKDLQYVQQAGARAVLIGESLVKQDDITQAVQNLYQP
ncbi:MAG: indole-3-glycerol phosphate synthase TrpC [Synechococcaceae cyanobacterium RL_1_2]|nr:indole-3-glycerol phosphate synthase TrpC [Synechococcaceae cyanobacterium RL_1_2]